MDAGQLYEKCVALGLCERATLDGLSIRFEDGLWKRGNDCPTCVSKESEANDLACMTVLRALEKHFESTGRWFPFHIRFNLESLCLCLLRAKGHETTPTPSP